MPTWLLWMVVVGGIASLVSSLVAILGEPKKHDRGKLTLIDGGTVEDVESLRVGSTRIN